LLLVPAQSCQAPEVIRTQLSQNRLVVEQDVMVEHAGIPYQNQEVLYGGDFARSLIAP
jgi:hypothetical protein